MLEQLSLFERLRFHGNLYKDVDHAFHLQSTSKVDLEPRRIGGVYKKRFDEVTTFECTDMLDRLMLKGSPPQQADSAESKGSPFDSLADLFRSIRWETCSSRLLGRFAPLDSLGELLHPIPWGNCSSDQCATCLRPGWNQSGDRVCEGWATRTPCIGYEGNTAGAIWATSLVVVWLCQNHF